MINEEPIAVLEGLLANAKLGRILSSSRLWPKNPAIHSLGILRIIIPFAHQNAMSAFGETKTSIEWLKWGRVADRQVPTPYWASKVLPVLPYTCRSPNLCQPLAQGMISTVQ